MRFLVSVALCLLVSEADGVKDFLMGRPKEGFRLPPHRLSEIEEVANVTTLWFRQKLDHFAPADSRTFNQRYMMKSTHFKTGGPIFLMLGGEGSISSGFMAEGIDYVVNAATYGAMLFQLEHRYYGATHPTPDASTSNLQYLSSEQALSDAANFIQTIKQEYQQLKNSKVIVFGGSYSGALANWFRLKYPHIAIGAVGSSAPVWALVDFYQYLEVVKNSLDMVSPGCSSLVQQAFSQLQTMVSAGQLAAVNATFNLCTPLNIGDSYSIMSFYAALIGTFQGAVQYNGQGPYQVLPLCQAMQNAGLGNLVQRLASIFHPERSCLSYSYKNDITFLQQNQWTDTYVQSGTRQWIYQTCTEFGYYQTTDSTNQPFGPTVSLQFYLDTYCRDVFGFTAPNVNTAVAQTQEIYGGLGLQSNWLVMPNGNVDPWHALSVLHNINPTSISVFMNGTSHCQDMGLHKANDIPALVQGRIAIAKQIGVILNQQYHNN